MNEVRISGVVEGVERVTYSNDTKVLWKVRLAIPKKVKEGDDWKTRGMPTVVTFFDDAPPMGARVLVTAHLNCREVKSNIYTDVVSDEWEQLVPKKPKDEPKDSADEMNLDDIPF